ncbi:histidine kinase [Desulfuromonas versatilis]|uniref:histidine kinase n=1 Tax=Desulfuromonas versatilis TaxID=2802975 RepID=A0ABM8HT62_9BACT|nr:response regulator [Desulfuromonas versatilis]BCR04209.1 histidine kinase [Desulfuromonas versatilis]
MPLRTEIALLLIEDNPGDARLLREMLDRSRFDLATRPTLGGGLDFLEANPVDLVLLDLSLPDSHGLDTLHTLRERVPHHPVVVLTGNDDDEIALGALHAGAQDYLVKGHFDEKLLTRSIRYALERHKIEAELIRTRQEWQDTLESLDDMITVHDTEFNVLLSNRAARAHLKIAPEVCRSGQKCHQYLHGLDSPHPGCVIARMLADGQPVSAELFEPHLQKYIETRAIPRVDARGRVIGAIHIVRDISERKRAEENERRNHQLSSAMTEAILSYLEGGNIRQMAKVMVSRCVEITGAGAGFLYELDSRGDARILALHEGAPASEKRLFQQIGKAADREHVYAIPRSHSLVFAPVERKQTILTNSPDGAKCAGGPYPPNHLPISSFLATPLFIGEEIVGVLGLANRPNGFGEREQLEIEAFAQTASLAVQTTRTEMARRTAIDHLRQSQKMEAVGQLAGGIAHDFNNLLTVIQGYSTLLIRALTQDEARQNDARTILKASERAAELVRSLLAFSRRQVFEPQVLDLNHLIRGTEKMLRRVIREDIEIELTLADKIPRVWADPVQIEQILMNLVVNARDAITDSGRILIETGTSVLNQAFVDLHPGAVLGTYATLSVKDTGCGMSEEIRLKVFEPFFTTKERGKGTGLGLSTVYGIVKQSGGYIEVHSKPEEGATFLIHLPCTERRVEKPAAPAAQALPALAKGVLVVEDEQGVLDLTARLLRSCGYQVVEADSPERALKIMENSAPGIDLLLTDVVMPGSNGFQLAERLRQIHPELKVLFMSGYAETAVSAPSEVTDGRNFIQKPFNLETLTHKIQAIFSPRDSAGPPQ